MVFLLFRRSFLTIKMGFLILSFKISRVRRALLKFNPASYLVSTDVNVLTDALTSLPDLFFKVSVGLVRLLLVVQVGGYRRRLGSQPLCQQGVAVNLLFLAAAAADRCGLLSKGCCCGCAGGCCCCGHRSSLFGCYCWWVDRWRHGSGKQFGVVRYYWGSLDCKLNKKCYRHKTSYLILIPVKWKTHLCQTYYVSRKSWIEKW